MTNEQYIRSAWPMSLHSETHIRYACLILLLKDLGLKQAQENAFVALTCKIVIKLGRVNNEKF